MEETTTTGSVATGVMQGKQTNLSKTLRGIELRRGKRRHRGGITVKEAIDRVCAGVPADKAFIEGVDNAPQYHDPTDKARICSICRFSRPVMPEDPATPNGGSSGGFCTLFNFTHNVGWACASWQPTVGAVQDGPPLLADGELDEQKFDNKGPSDDFGVTKNGIVVWFGGRAGAEREIKRLQRKDKKSKFQLVHKQGGGLAGLDGKKFEDFNESNRIGTKGTIGPLSADTVAGVEAIWKDRRLDAIRHKLIFFQKSDQAYGLLRISLVGRMKQAVEIIAKEIEAGNAARLPKNLAGLIRLDPKLKGDDRPSEWFGIDAEPMIGMFKDFISIFLKEAKGRFA